MKTKIFIVTILTFFGYSDIYAQQIMSVSEATNKLESLIENNRVNKVYKEIDKYNQMVSAGNQHVGSEHRATTVDTYTMSKSGKYEGDNGSVVEFGGWGTFDIDYNEKYINIKNERYDYDYNSSKNNVSFDIYKRSVNGNNIKFYCRKSDRVFVFAIFEKYYNGTYLYLRHPLVPGNVPNYSAYNSSSIPSNNTNNYDLGGLNNGSLNGRVGNNTSTPQKTRYKTCPRCKGNRTVAENRNISVAHFGTCSHAMVTCRVCNFRYKECNTHHTHKTCTVCNGNGQVVDYSY